MDYSTYTHSVFQINQVAITNPIKLSIFIYFLGGTILIVDILNNQTLGFKAKTTLSLFNVTHTSIINFDFSSKFNNLPSTNYKKLHYQSLKLSNASVSDFTVDTLSKLN